MEAVYRAYFYTIHIFTLDAFFCYDVCHDLPFICLLSLLAEKIKLMLITIDGPSGVGKGTLAKRLANHFGYAYLDTGLLFRQLAYFLQMQGVDGEDAQAIAVALENAPAQFDFSENDVRTDDLSQMASKISVHPGVRAFQKKLQEDFVLHHKGCAVLDGRDLGAYVFPNAQKKLFLDARPDVRAQRRLNDLKNRGLSADYKTLLASIEARDDRDRKRPTAPLRAADDALIIDTSDLTIEEVFQKSLEFIASS